MVGMMGSGKTTVGRLIARRVGVEFVDTDREVESEAGISISEIFSTRGEEAFRRMEREGIRRASLRGVGVVATGGGVVLDPDNVEVMRNTGTVVWLDAPVEVLASRLAGTTDRPLLEEAADPEAGLARLLSERRRLYSKAAHHRVEVADRTPDEVAEEVISLWVG